MLIYNDQYDNLRLYKKIFKKRRDLNIDSSLLTIISGYLSACMMIDLVNLGFDNINVIIGMKPKGLEASQHQSLLKIQRDYPHIKFFYTKRLVHSKLYIWHDECKINEYCIGSANFSVEIKYKLHKEILVSFENKEDNIDFGSEIKVYKDLIETNKVPISEVHPTSISPVVIESDNLSLLSSSTQSAKNIIGFSTVINEPNACSALNWGYSSGQPRLKDAYIGIVKSFISANKNLIPTRGDEEKIAFEAIWDDGENMLMCFTQEGCKFENEKYPKGIESDNNKNLLGNYLRRRISKKLGVDFVISDMEQDLKLKWKSSKTKLSFKQHCHKLGLENIYNSIRSKYISIDVLKNYGRTDIGITKEKLDDNIIYRLDFSV